jgi:hypothetical protein
MGQPVHAFRHQPAEEAIEVGLHVRIGIFLDQQRAGGVAHINRQEPAGDIGSSNELPHRGRKFVEALPLRRNGERIDCLLHPSGLS